jgi:hypothetical protein
LQGRSGDPSPNTARGVFRAMQAADRLVEKILEAGQKE